MSDRLSSSDRDVTQSAIANSKPQQLQQPLLSIFEDSPEFSSHKQRVYQSASGHGASHPASNERPAVRLLESVSVNPKAVRTASLRVFETRGRLPSSDLCPPLDRQPVEAELIVGQLSCSHRDRSGCHERKMKKRRRQSLSIREKYERIWTVFIKIRTRFELKKWAFFQPPRTCGCFGCFHVTVLVYTRTQGLVQD